MSPSPFVDAALLLAAVPAAAAGAYLGALATAARGRRAPAPGADTRFDVIVPAHNEALGIEETVRSLLAMDYPRDRFRVVVVADNCTDDTAARARAAGATVLERVDAERRGKGYALALAYETSLADGFADAVVVVDADTAVTPNLLGAFAARFERGEESVQASYLVRNVTASWRTRLMSVALAMYHTLRSLGRERLRLSAGLRGNGMGFSRGLLARVPHAAYSIVEDVEYGVALGLAGVRVAYVHEANVFGEMPTTGAAARSQRERWERGRGALVRAHVPTLLREGIRRRDRVLLDLAADLLVPPLVTLVAAAVGGTLATLLLQRLGWASVVSLGAWGVALAGLALYVVVGCVLSGNGPRVVLDLAAAPLYIAWKLAIRLRPARRAPSEWVRTRRVAEQ
jgi:GT2 family glycosyltransferase